MDLVDLALDLVPGAAHGVERLALVLQGLDQGGGVGREDRVELPLGLLEALERAREVRLHPQAHVGIRERASYGGERRFVLDLLEPLLDLLETVGDERSGRREQLDIEPREPLPHPGQLAALEEPAELGDRAVELGGKEPGLGAHPDGPLHALELLGVVPVRLDADLFERLLQEMVGRLDLHRLEMLARSVDGRAERLERDLAVREATEELLQGFELAPGRVQVRGELGDAIDRLLGRGQRLRIDVETQRLPRPVHRGEDLARVPAQTTGIREPGPDLIEEAGDDRHDGGLGDLSGAGEDLRQLDRSGLGTWPASSSSRTMDSFASVPRSGNDASVARIDWTALATW